MALNINRLIILTRNLSFIAMIYYDIYTFNAMAFNHKFKFINSITTVSSISAIEIICRAIIFCQYQVQPF